MCLISIPIQGATTLQHRAEAKEHCKDEELRWKYYSKTSPVFTSVYETIKNVCFCIFMTNTFLANNVVRVNVDDVHAYSGHLKDSNRH